LEQQWILSLLAQLIKSEVYQQDYYWLELCSC